MNFLLSELLNYKTFFQGYKIKKERIDKLMVSNGLAKSREQANSLLMSGNVFINEKRSFPGFNSVRLLKL